MKAFVVDTNVPIVANGQADHADSDCILACLKALEEVRRTKIVLDDDLRIVSEYFHKLSRSGEPGPGDAFVKWAYDNQANPARCEQVHITPKPGAREDYEEFPEDPQLEGFDPSDRKFAAAARASQLKPKVLNAVDTDWWRARRPLARRGVHVEFLCPQAMQRGTRSPSP